MLALVLTFTARLAGEWGSAAREIRTRSACRARAETPPACCPGEAHALVDAAAGPLRAFGSREADAIVDDAQLRLWSVPVSCRGWCAAGRDAALASASRHSKQAQGDIKA